MIRKKRKKKYEKTRQSYQQTKAQIKNGQKVGVGGGGICRCNADIKKVIVNNLRNRGSKSV